MVLRLVWLYTSERPLSEFSCAACVSRLYPSGPAVGHPHGRNRGGRRSIINAKPLFTRTVIGYASGGRVVDGVPTSNDGPTTGRRQSSSPFIASCILRTVKEGGLDASAHVIPAAAVPTGVVTAPGNYECICMYKRPTPRVI